MKARLPKIALIASLFLAACGGETTDNRDPGPAQSANDGREILFADEFDGPALDRDKWIVIGPDFKANDEEQSYVDSEETIAFSNAVEGAEGGALILKPIYRPDHVDPVTERAADFLSGRIESKGKFDFTYGRAEARIRMTDTVGAWPAFWLLGNGQWPDTGEIDIMEYVGEKGWIGVALHGPGYSGETPLVNKYFFPEDEDATGWHTYAVEWTSQKIDFEIDGRLTYRVTRPMVAYYGDWRFDTPKHIILNMAVGGTYPLKNNGIMEPYVGLPPGTVEQIKSGEVAMYVDWVRIYAPE